MQFVYFILAICSPLLFVTCFTKSASSPSSASSTSPTSSSSSSSSFWPLSEPYAGPTQVILAKKEGEKEADGDKCKMNDENRSSSEHFFDPSVKSDQRELFFTRLEFGGESKQINKRKKKGEEEKMKKKTTKDGPKEPEGEEEELLLILPHYHPHLTLKRSTQVPEQQDGRVLEERVFHKARPGEMFFRSTFVSPKTMADTWRDLRTRRPELSPLLYRKKQQQHQIRIQQATQETTTATATTTTITTVDAASESTTEPEVTGSTALHSSIFAESSFLSSSSPKNNSSNNNNSNSNNKLPSTNYTSGRRMTKRSADLEGGSNVQIPNESSLLSGVEKANISCRVEFGFKLPLFLYALHTCGKCYFYLPDYAFKPGRKLQLIGLGELDDPNLEKRVVYSNETAILFRTFASASMFAKWQQCCADAIECCLKHLRHHGSHSNNNNFHHPASASSTTSGTFTFSRDSHPASLTVNQENQFIPSTKSAFFDSFFHSSQANSRNKRSQDEPLVCPRTWDGWTCWKDDVPVGVTVQNTCPEHIYWRINVPPCRGYVTKTCTSSGWYVNNNNSEWSNYTNCARDDIHIRRLRYSIITNLISVSFILPALVIFNCYRQLSNSPRIRLHKHLFASLFIYAILSSLLKLNLLMKRSDDVYISKDATSQNSSSDYYCLVLSLSLRYFRSTTYLNMFNEAYYLYQLIKKVFDAPPVTPLILMAYIIPLTMTGTYVAARSLLPVFTSSDLTATATATASATTTIASMSSTLQLPSIRVEHLVEITTKGPSEFTSSSSPTDLVYKSIIVNSTSQWVNVTGEITKANDIEVDDDPCWMLPARDSWKEWIINGPNLAMLLINSLLILPIVKEIYMKATSMPLPSQYSSRPVRRTDSKCIEPSGSNNKRSKSQLNRSPVGPPGTGTKVKCHNRHSVTSKDGQGHHNNCSDSANGEESGDVSLLSTMKVDSQSQTTSTTTTASGLRSSTHVNSQSTAGGHSVSKASLLVSLRAATLLLPLYGLHYLVIVYRPDIDNCWLSELYHYLSLTLDGLQGFLVSILFCFGNNEVRQLLKRTLGKKSDANIYLTEIVPVPRASP